MAYTTSRSLTHGAGTLCTNVHGVNKRAGIAERVVSFDARPFNVKRFDVKRCCTPARATFSVRGRARSTFPHDVRVRVVIAPAGCTWYAQGWRTVFVHGRRVRERGGDGYSDSESG